MPDATSAASEVRRGKTAAASSSALKYGCARVSEETCTLARNCGSSSSTYESVAHQRRSDNGGGNGVDADAVRAEEVGHASGDTEHTGYV